MGRTINHDLAKDLKIQRRGLDFDVEYVDRFKKPIWAASASAGRYENQGVIKV